MIVTNKNGKEIDFEEGLKKMNPEVRSSLQGIEFPSEQAFFTAYENKHHGLLGEEWELSK